MNTMLAHDKRLKNSFSGYVFFLFYCLYVYFFLTLLKPSRTNDHYQELDCVTQDSYVYIKYNTLFFLERVSLYITSKLNED